MLFIPDDEGQSLVEYALILLLVALAVILLLTLLATPINAIFSQIGSALNVGGS